MLGKPSAESYFGMLAGRATSLWSSCDGGRDFSHPADEAIGERAPCNLAFARRRGGFTISVMASARLILQSVEFAHPGMTAPLFTDLTVEFPVGWTGIVGPNGAGKTTLLKMATGELAPQSGTVQQQGLALYVAQRTDAAPEQFEDFIWAPDAGVLKARLRIGEDWPERWPTLSHGERKRAQIAVALWREPAVLALDEPSNHIDADARRLSSLFDGLHHGDPEVVKAAMLAIAAEPDPRVIVHLGACLDQSAWDVRRLAADLLGRAPSEASAALLRARLSVEADPMVKDALSRALESSGQRRSRPPRRPQGEL